MSFTPYIGLRLLEDFIKREKVTKHISRLRKLKYADPEVLNNYKLDALKQLLTHAYLNVPFYKKRFDGHKIRPEDLKSLEDFAEFPMLSRDDIKNHGHDILSTNVDKKSLRSDASSGSTGEPITYFYDRTAYSAGRAAVLIGWEMAGKGLGDRFTTLWGNIHTVEEKWTKPSSRIKAKLYKNNRIPAYTLTNETKVKEALDLMISQKGGFLQGYTYALHALALYAQQHEIHIEPKFDGILTTAEMLFPHQRKLLEEVFGPVYDGYGCQEIMGIAFQCQERKDYHIVDPNVVFETRDFSGDTKEIIVTDLWNYSWPLIRYQIGDLTSGETSHCPCGCTWRAVKEIEGRTSDIVTTPSGGLLHLAGFVAGDFYKYLNSIEQFQFAKVAPDKIVLRLQVWENQSINVNQMKTSLEPFYRNLNMDLDIELVDNFEFGKSGKHKMLVDETVDSDFGN